MIELDLQCASTGAAPAAADLQRWCELALRQRSGDSELTIRLVDEEEGRELNRTWRQKDYATNVLSFPANVPDEFSTFRCSVTWSSACRWSSARQWNRARPSTRTGRIWSSMAACICSATITSKMPAEEMEALERQLLAELGHPDPYAEDSPETGICKDS